MKKLTRAPNLITAHHWINVLSTAGIACEMHNRYLSGAMGEIPADQCAPEIWIADDRDEALATEILERAKTARHQTQEHGDASNAAKRWKVNSRCAGNAEQQETR